MDVTISLPEAGSDARFTTYFAEIHGWLWLLTMSADCRIYQNRTITWHLLGSLTSRGLFENWMPPGRERCARHREQFRTG
ncbi:MAG: Phage tail baseplate hub [Acidobacteriota bacterium]|jgi:hypothetical protein|nr:Phage tail baseplate hub [Acidobacteriota bacterium]